MYEGIQDSGRGVRAPESAVKNGSGETNHAPPNYPRLYCDGNGECTRIAGRIDEQTADEIERSGSGQDSDTDNHDTHDAPTEEK